MQQSKKTIDAVRDNIKKVIIGKDGVIDLVLTSLFAGGHILIDDVPGIGKTMLATALCSSVGGQFNRIQFTPDLLPSDVTGVNVFDQKTGEFDFREGPVFANVLLADELNRATPRTQSSLLEAMGEEQVTVDHATHLLPQPFFVVATQNSIESEGIFPLLESQMDRFMMSISMGYPSFDEEVKIIRGQANEHPIKKLGTVTSIPDIIHVRESVRNVRMDESIERYAIEIVSRTRASADFSLGSSPRGSIVLVRAAKAFAVISGRDYCVPDDVKQLAISVLRHRVISASGRNSSDTSAAIESILSETAVPV